MTSYSLNTQAVRDADKSSRIDASGKYVGVFTRVEPYETDNGAQAIAFDFKAEEGDANFTVYLTSNEGEKTFGTKQLHSMMAVFRLKEIETKKAVVEKYDFDTKKNIRVEADVLLDMMNKPVGLLLQKDLITKKDGKDSYRLNLFGAFDPKTELTGSEILDGKTTPEVLYKRIERLKDKDSRKGKPSNQSSGAMPSDHPAAMDIPL